MESKNYGDTSISGLYLTDLPGGIQSMPNHSDLTTTSVTPIHRRSGSMTTNQGLVSFMSLWITVLT
jgi:hypothetical protein